MVSVRSFNFGICAIFVISSLNLISGVSGRPKMHSCIEATFCDSQFPRRFYECGEMKKVIDCLRSKIPTCAGTRWAHLSSDLQDLLKQREEMYKKQSTSNVDEENTDRINYKSTTEIESENPQLDKKQSTDYVYVLSIGLSLLLVLPFFAWLYYCFVRKTNQNKEKEQNPMETKFETFTKETSKTSMTSSSYYTSEILETSSTSYSSDLNIQTNGARLEPVK